MTTDGKIVRVVVLRQAIAAWCVAICLVLCVVSHAQAEDILEPNFKATTDDECIREKECVWYHFVLATQLDASKGIATKNLNVRKWEKPVRFSIRARKTNEEVQNYTSVFNGYMEQLFPFFSQDLKPNQKHNFLVLFTDDIEKEITEEYGDVLSDIAGEVVGYKLYNQIPLEQRKCYFLMAQSSKQEWSAYVFFSFVQLDHENVQGCLREVVYAGFGLSNHISSPIWDEAKATKFYTKTELLILALLSQSAVDSGMTYGQLKGAFDKLYAPMIKKLQEVGVFDE